MVQNQIMERDCSLRDQMVVDKEENGGVGGGGGGGGGVGEPQKQKTIPITSTRSKGKSCKGCLYYSSLQKSKSQKPTCVGIPRTLQQVPSYIVGQSELEASKEGRSLIDFKYACVGYSVYLDKTDSPTDQQDKRAELPFCVGLEVLLDKRTSTADHVPAHAHQNDAHKGQGGPTLPQPRPYRPPSHSTGDEYFSRFKRNAGIVASGVARNVNKVGNYLKASLDDILYPYRRRPK